MYVIDRCIAMDTQTTEVFLYKLLFYDKWRYTDANLKLIIKKRKEKWVGMLIKYRKSEINEVYCDFKHVYDFVPNVTHIFLHIKSKSCEFNYKI